MLDYLVRRSRVTERKARLFACACCRRVWPLLNELARNSVDVAERFADGLATEADRREEEGALQEFLESWVYPSNNTWADDARVYHGVSAAMCAVTFYDDYLHGPLHGAGGAPQQAAFAVGPGNVASTDERCAPEKARQAELVRCVFGSPFRLLSIDPRWQSTDARQLAQGIYDGRAFDRLAALADALLEARCDDQILLAHCREDEEHCRGCWVVDLVLGKL
jgi:hypothetical protein